MRSSKGDEIAWAICRVSAIRTGEIDGMEVRIQLSHLIRLTTFRKYSTDGAFRSRESIRRSNIPTSSDGRATVGFNADNALRRPRLNILIRVIMEAMAKIESLINCSPGRSIQTEGQTQCDRCNFYFQCFIDRTEFAEPDSFWESVSMFV